MNNNQYGQGSIVGYKFLKTRVFQYDEDTPIRAGIDKDGNRYIVLRDVVTALGYSRGYQNSLIKMLGVKAEVMIVKHIKFCNGTKMLCADKDNLALILENRCFNLEFSHWLLDYVMSESELEIDLFNAIEEKHEEKPKTNADIVRDNEDRERGRSRADEGYQPTSPSAYISESYVFHYDSKISVRVVVEPDGQRLVPLIDIAKSLGYASSNGIRDWCATSGIQLIKKTILYSTNKVGTAQAMCADKTAAEQILVKKCRNVDLYYWYMKEIYANKGKPEKEEMRTSPYIDTNAENEYEITNKANDRLGFLFDSIMTQLAEIKTLISG